MAQDTLDRWVLTGSGPMPARWYRLCQNSARQDRDYLLFKAWIKSRYIEMALIVSLVLLEFTAWMLLAFFVKPISLSFSTPVGMAISFVAGALPFAAGTLGRRGSYWWLRRRIPSTKSILETECKLLLVEHGDRFDWMYQRDATRAEDAQSLDWPYGPPV